MIIKTNLFTNYLKMKAKNGSRFELDIKNIIQVIGALFVGVLSIYLYNAPEINTILGRYIDGQTLTVIIMVLSYLAKKYVTDYSSSKAGSNDSN